MSGKTPLQNTSQINTVKNIKEIYIANKKAACKIKN